MLVVKICIDIPLNIDILFYMNIKRRLFQDYKTNEVSYGFCSWDDAEQTYSNLMSRSELELENNEFLHLLVNQYADDTFTRLFDWALHHTNFIVIDDVEYHIEHDENGWKLIDKE